jgi:hypothetical protein
MRRYIVMASVIAVLCGSLGQFADAGDASLEQALIEGASTPQQHAALANYYEARAADERKDAEAHRAMGKSYAGTKMTQAAAMKDHCDKLAKAAEEQAKEYDALATAHRSMAK